MFGKCGGGGEEREKKNVWLEKNREKTFFMGENHMTSSALTLFQSDEIFFANRIEALYPSIVLRKQEEREWARYASVGNRFKCQTHK